jgi:translation initiation factor 2B subunit (eIF-2B alpha/beta/delta family)
MKQPKTFTIDGAASNRDWLRRLVRWLASPYFPELEKEQTLITAKHLGEKLRATKSECEEWRKRALSAEDAIRAIKRGVTDAAQKHDDQNGTSLHWWV